MIFCVVLGGKLYLSSRSFERRKIGRTNEYELYRDLYGRRVFAFRERYPCFDSYDYQNENRCFHWYYVDCGERVALLYWDDGGGRLVLRRVRREDFRSRRQLQPRHLEILEACRVRIPSREE